MDDFGDLYGDLDCRMNVKERVKAESKAADVDSAAEESESNVKMTTFDAKEMLNLDEENSDDDSESDDDDDFRIVLNEDESSKFQQPKGGVVGIDAEDECDGVADRLNNDQKWNNQLPAAAADESVQGSEARGVPMSGGHRPSRSVGSHLGGFPSSVRASVSGRGACDNPHVPCFQGSASYNRDISAAAQTGGTFCLPRNRTIFDVNIEVFEHKPWWHHGEDIADYFNFGLNEESWKSYCEVLDQFRKQGVMSNRFPVYPTSRLNQGGRNYSVLESLEKGGRQFDMPKGREIQVEGGLGERIPSTDIRRPRVLDSDVVIHINVEGSVEDPSALCKGNLKHAEEYIDASLPTSGNNLKQRVLSAHYDGQIGRHITNSIEHYSPRLNGSNFRVTSGKVKSNADCKKDDNEDLLRTYAMFESGSGSGDQVPHISGSCNFQSHSEESKDVFSNGKGTRPIRKASVVLSQDSIESDYHLSYDSVSGTTESEHEDGKDVAHERDLSSGEYRHFSRTRLSSVAGLNDARDDERPSNMIHRKHHNNLDLADIRCKTRKRKFSHHTDDIRRRLYSYRETEVSLSYKSRTHAAKHETEKIFAKDSRKSNCGTHRSRSWDEEDCVEQRECYFSERGHEARCRRSSIRKYTDQSVSINKSFFKEKDAEEREDEHWTGMGPEYDDIIHDRRYRDRGVQDMHGKHIDIYDMAEESFDLNFPRHVYPIDRKIKSLERSRYDETSSFERNRSIKSFEKDADYRLVLHRYEEPYHTDERDWHDTCLPREHLRSSWRSSGRCMNRRVHPNIGHLQLKSKKYGRVVPSIKDHHLFSYEDGLESDIDGYIFEGNAYSEDFVSSIHMRRHNQLSKPNLHTDDGARFRHCELDGLPSPERFLLEKSLKHENYLVRKPSFHSQRLLGGRLLNNARKIRVAGTSDSDARDHVNFVPDMGRHELAAVGCREAVNKHLNGFKGKLARICRRGVAAESQKEIDTGYKDDQLMNSRQLKEDMKQEEIYPRVSKGEGSHNHQTTLNVDKVQDSKSFNSIDRTKILLGKLSVSQNVEDNEIEEGELIEESNKQDVISGKKVNFQSKDSLCSVKVAGLYNKSHILDTLAKMEKRKERFKELTAPKQEPEKSVDPKVDVSFVSVVSDEVKQQRPARKRRWGGN